MSIKLINTPKNKSAVLLRIESFMPRILMSISKEGCRVYKEKKRHSAYSVGNEGKFGECLITAVAGFKILQRQEKKKAQVLFNKAEAKGKVKTLDEVFGHSTDKCELFNLNDIKEEIERLEKDRQGK